MKLTPVEWKALLDEQQAEIDRIYAADAQSGRKACAPFMTLGKELVESIKNLDGKILVVSDLGLLTAVCLNFMATGRDMNNVTYIANSPAQAKFIATHGLGAHVIQIGYNDCLNVLAKELANMKFDVIIGNPPYKKGLHMKFIYTLFPKHLAKGGEFLFIHPATEFIKQGKGQVRKEIPGLLPHIKSLQLKNPIGLFGPVRMNTFISITHLTEKANDTFLLKSMDGKTSIELTNLQECSVHSFKPGYSLFKKKALNSFGVKSFADSVKWENEIDDPTHEYFVEFGGIAGHCDGTPDMPDVDSIENGLYNMVHLHHEVLTKDQLIRTSKYRVGFRTLEEAQNFIKYCQTKFVMACLSIYKYNLHIYMTQLTTIPMIDCSRSWTNDEVMEHFGLVEEEQAFVNGMFDFYGWWVNMLENKSSRKKRTKV